MPIETFAALLMLTFAGCWTSGPNNAMLAASGVNFGLARTVPHINGVWLGFAGMVFLVAVFLGEAFQQSALLRETLRWGGAALLLWVAWQIATKGGLPSDGGEAKPFTFWQAAAFQWVNAKAWVMAVAISAQFVRPEAPWLTAGLVALAFALAGVTSSLGWAAAGQGLRRFLADPLRLRVFNAVMGLSIALGVVLMVMDGPVAEPMAAPEAAP